MTTVKELLTASYRTLQDPKNWTCDVLYRDAWGHEMDDVRVKHDPKYTAKVGKACATGEMFLQSLKLKSSDYNLQVGIDALHDAANEFFDATDVVDLNDHAEYGTRKERHQKVLQCYAYAIGKYSNE